MTTYKAAVAQAASFPDDPRASAAKAAALIREAAAAGARLIVFPEAFVGGYPKGASFGCPIGMRRPEGREAFRHYYDAAIDLRGAEVANIAEATAATGIFAVIGVVEREGGTLYCSVLFFESPHGTLMGKHRKLMPTAAERLVWGYGDGSTMPVFDTPIGKLGTVICWENYMPMLRMHMYAQGIQIYCAPTADDRETWLSTPASHRPGGTLLRADGLPAYQAWRLSGRSYESALGDAAETVMMRGGSAIIDPLGRVLAGPNFSDETILYADIDLEQIVRGKFDFDVSGHYARPDIFQLIVDDRPKRAVSALDDRSNTGMA